MGAASIALVGAANAQVLVDYDNQLGGTAAPVAGAQYWHNAVNTGTAGQNRNVGRWDAPTEITSGSAAATNNISRVSATPPTPGLASGNAYELRWSFIGTAPASTTRSPNEADTFLRVASAGSAMANPVIDTTKLLQFDIWTAQPLRVAAIISEAAQTAAVGSPGVANASIEVVGGTGDNRVEPAPALGYGGYLLTAGTWQTVTVDWTAITLRGLTGNGVFNPTTPDRVALSGLGFTPIAGEGGLQVQHAVYLDNFRLTPASAVPEPATMLALAAGVAALGARRRRAR